MYADPRRHPVNFEVGYRVYLKVSSWKGVIRFGKRGKLAPRYIGPFKIIQRVNDQTVVLELSEKLAGIHNTFNVCYLRKCMVDNEMQLVPLSDLRVDLNQKLVEELVRIIDRKIETHGKIGQKVSFCQTLWYKQMVEDKIQCILLSLEVMTSHGLKLSNNWIKGALLHLH
ncbi:uncharacterized protein [Rutidosis leptorrhynchoides]|uniref:uncharacterized protein n=1 Tax=Rutidosis leptorrhynchoides TaxID=125765 RepID=UPI003A9A506D